MVRDTSLYVYGRYTAQEFCDNGLSGPGLYSWMEIRESESELREFYDKCHFRFGWTRWQRFKMWLFRKYPKTTGYEDLTCCELDDV